MRVALVGQAGVGKSTLVYTFSKFLERRGLTVAVANLDSTAKRLPYKPQVDARKDKEAGKKAVHLHAQFVLLDTPYDLESALYGNGQTELPKVCEVALIIADAHHVQEWEALDFFDRACVLASEALGVPVLGVLNKSDLAKGAKPRKAQALEAHDRAHSRSGALRVSAVTRDGFEELLEALQKE